MESFECSDPDDPDNSSDPDESSDSDNIDDSDDFDFNDYDVFEKQHIPDEILWRMFATGASFRALSNILELAFATANVANEFHTSYAYLHNSYQRLLKLKESTYKGILRGNNSLGTICFDHQNAQKVTRKFEGTTHRLALVWHCDDVHNVLGMIPMLNKTAESQALAIKQTCDEFNIEGRQIVALSCDNEMTNVGVRGGTCSLVEREIDRPLLRLMCRHHVLEIVVKDVYHHLFKSDTPNNEFYGILKGIWHELREADFPMEKFNENTFAEVMGPAAHEVFEDLKSSAIKELLLHSKNKEVRDDYREVTLVALKFFGMAQNTTKTNQVKFRTLINPSNARFMATIIQGLECYLFRNSIDWDSLNRIQLDNVTRFSIFASLIYVRFWNRANNLFDAPVNDLYMLQELEKYQSIDSEVAKVATMALSRHLYYMGEELAPLALFSKKLSIHDKNIAAAKLLSSFDKILPPRNMKRNHISYIDINDENWRSKSIVDLIGDRSRYFFDIMNLHRNFLNIDSSGWESNRDYMHAKNIVQGALVCVNDGSERVVSNCKNKLQKQRCRKESTFQQNILNLQFNPNM